MVEYRSGHNGGDLKSSVRVKAPVGSNPTSTAIQGGRLMAKPTVSKTVTLGSNPSRPASSLEQ